MMSTAFRSCLIIFVVCLASPLLTFAAKNSAKSEDQQTIIHYAQPTKEEAEAAVDEYRKWGKQVGSKMLIEFTTLETPHFLVFTDWDPREFDFLKENVEKAYTAVSRQMELPSTGNVFVGKLPVMMFARREDFEKFAKEFDKLDAKKLAGYFGSNRDGFGHMAMWKPDLKSANGDLHAAEREWAYVLTHEFTHAFVSRYHTNVFMPRWLSEGVAEVVAYGQFPRAGVHAYVKRMAANGKGISGIFEDKDIASFKATDYYFAQTVVETMIAGDSRAFLHYFNDIKDGMDPDDALEKNYHTDRAGLQKAWKKYVAMMANN